MGDIGKKLEEFENLYEAEGYYLAASAYIRIPFFQCTLRCECMTMQSMTELDTIVCKCIQKGINTIADISFVLALDTRILEGEIEVLALAGVVQCQGDKVFLTEKGEEAVRIQARTERECKDFNVYMNAISGVWSPNIMLIDREEMNDVEGMCLEPIVAVDKNTIEQSKDVQMSLQGIGTTNILSMKLLDYKTICYEERRMLMYKEEGKRKIVFVLYDDAKEQFDVKTAAALMKQYERRELVEILRLEEYIAQNEQSILEAEQRSFKYLKPIQTFRYCRNKEIRQLFNGIFKSAKESIYIISPWIDNKGYVMTDKLLSEIEDALKNRKIQITIGYGYLSKEKMDARRKKYEKSTDEKKKEADRDWQTWLMAEKLKERFGKYENFSIFYAQTHEKILCIDDEQTLVGSYNLLSYDGGEKDCYQGVSFRFEGGVMIEDKEFAKQVKKIISEEASM